MTRRPHQPTSLDLTAALGAAFAGRASCGSWRLLLVLGCLVGSFGLGTAQAAAAPAHGNAVGLSAAASASVASDHALSRAIGACLAREDPACAAPWLAELEKRAAGSFSLAFVRAHLDFLRGRFQPAAAAFSRVAASPIAPAALKPQARQLAARAKASLAATRGFVRRPVAKGRFVIWLQPGPDEVLVPLLDEVLSRALPALTARLGAAPAAPIAVHIYPRVETLAKVSGLTAEQVRTSGTIALCKYNRLMITSPRDLVFGYHWADTVSHELVHYLVLKRGGPQVPVWLHEALARTLEASWRDDSAPHLDADERALLRRARRTRRFVPLRKMHPTMAALPSQEAAQTAFAEVHHALLWLLDRARRRAAAAAAQPEFSGLLARLNAAPADDPRGALDAVRNWAGAPGFPGRWWAAMRRRPRGERGGAAGREPRRGGRRGGRRGVRAKLHFRRAEGAQSPSSSAHLTPAAARHAELGDRLLAAERPLAAVLEYRKAQAAGAGDDVLMLTRLGRALLKLKRAAEAKRVADDALTRHRHHAPLLLLRAQVSEALGERAAARRWAREMAWINPYDPGLTALQARLAAP